MPFLQYSLEKKQWMAISGLFLSLFVLSHMLGNLLALFSPEDYNLYAHSLTSSPFIYIAEAFLLFVFVIHVLLAICITWENRKSRGTNYYSKPKTRDEGAITMASKFMIYSGIIVLVFLVQHLNTFKFGPWYNTGAGGEEIRDLHRLVVEVFQDPYYVSWYSFVMLILGLHLSHGVESMFQTFGLNNDKWNYRLKVFSFCFTFIVSAGFLLVPLYTYFQGSL